MASAGVGTRRSPLVLPRAGLAGHQTSVPTSQAALAMCGAGQAMAAAGRFASLLSDVLLSSFSASFAFQIASDVALSVLRLPSCPGGWGAHPGSGRRAALGALSVLPWLSARPARDLIPFPCSEL